MAFTVLSPGAVAVEPVVADGLGAFGVGPRNWRLCPGGDGRQGDTRSARGLMTSWASPPFSRRIDWPLDHAEHRAPNLLSRLGSIIISLSRAPEPMERKGEPLIPANNAEVS